jgi:KDO2-lipid IV(A) lauroyltransferase
MKPIIHLLEAVLVYMILGIIKLIGIDMASNLGGFLARTIGPKLRATNYAKRNIKFVFPEMTNEQIDQVIIKMWDNLGRTFFELPHIYKLSDKEFKKRVQVIGLEHFKSATKNGCNILGVSGHFGNWEVALRYLMDSGLKLAAVYRHLNNRWVDRLMVSQRDARMLQVRKDQAKAILASLKNGYSIAMLCDQKLLEGMLIDFFNRPAYTTTTPAKLASNYGVPILLARVIRTKGAYFQMKFYKVLHAKDFDGSVEVMKEINRMYELWVRETPEQWFWVHRRWEKEFYH